MGDWNFFDPAWLSALPVAAVAWVGRVHQRVNRNESDLVDARAKLEKHEKEDREWYAKVAKIDGKLDAMSETLSRIDDRLSR